MPVTAYSTRFLLTGADSTWVTFTCPAGHRAVLRDVSSFHSGGAGTTQLVVSGFTVYWHSFPAQSLSDHLDLRQVFYAGEVLALYQAGGSIETAVSGYLFRDELGRQEYEHDGIEDSELRPPAWALMRDPR